MAKSKKRGSSGDSLPFNTNGEKDEDKRPVLYRDGKPVSHREPKEVAKIWKNHADPSHSDYNPEGKTLRAAKLAGGADYINGAIEEKAEMQAARKAGGKQRAKERRQASQQNKQRVLEERDRLLKSGKDPHEVAGIISNIIGISPSQVRKILAAEKKRA